MLVFAAAALLGCGDAAAERTILGPDEVAGIYALESAANQSLPATTVEGNGYRMQILAGTYGLASNGTFTSSLTIRETIQTHSAPSVTTYDERASGVYQVTAQIVRFTDADGRQTTGRLAGGTLIFDGVPARTYRK